MLWLLFGQRLLLNKTFPVHTIFTFYWDVSAPLGVEEYKSDLIGIKPYNPMSNESPDYCCHQNPLTFSAKKTKQNTIPTGRPALCWWHFPCFPVEHSWMPYSINTNPTDSIPSGTEPSARPPTVALIAQDAEEWDHCVEFWGMASRWEQSDKASNYHWGGKKSN